MKINFTRKKVITGASILAAVILTVVILISQTGKDEDTTEYENQKVSTVSMEQTLTAAGEVAAAETEDIEFSTSKTFKTMCVEENETVVKGQHMIMYSNGTYEDAPADGVVTSINAPETGSVADSSNVLTFGKTGSLSLDITVPEDEISEISKGDKATIVVNSDTSKTFYGTITGKKAMSTTLISEKTSSSTDNSGTSSDSDSSSDSSSTSSGSSGSTSSGSSGSTSSGSSGSTSSGSSGSSSSGGSDPFGSESSTAYYTVSMKFKNDGTIETGMSASCTITISDRSNVLAVPVEAIYYDKNNKPYVKIADGNSVEKRSVEIGESDASNVEITKGLKKGDIIQVPKQK